MSASLNVGDGGERSMRSAIVTGRCRVVTALVLACLMSGPTFATEYATNPDPNCRLMRNAEPGLPYPAEPNRDDTRAAMVANSVPGSYPKTLRLVLKIDSDGTAALAQLPPTLPRIDLVIDRHITNLVWARSVLGFYLESGRVGGKDVSAAVAAYQRAIGTNFVDDRGCKHWSLPSLDTFKRLAGMYLYGVGVPADPAKAREVLAQGGAQTQQLLAALDENRLPGSYRELVMDRPPPKRGPTIEEKQEALLKAFGIETDPGPGPWFGTLLAAVLFALVLGVAVYTAWEMGAKAHADGSSGPRGIGGVYEVIRAAFDRLDLLFKALFALFLGLTVLHYLWDRSWNWMYSPWIAAGFDYALIVIMIGMAGRGLFTVVEALRRKHAAGKAQAHGDARPASEPEAQAAARSDTKDPFHDRTFSD
jgi:hypothetical protein